MSSQPATIRVIKDKGESNNPYLISFPQNVPPASFLTAQEDAEERIKANLYSHKEIKAKKLLHLTNSHFDWLASNTGRSFQKVQSTSYAVGLYNKDTNEIKMMPVEQIFSMKQYSKSMPDQDEHEIMFSNVKALQQKQILVEDFGNKKSKRILKTLKSTLVKDDNIEGAGDIKDRLIKKAGDLEQKLLDNPEDSVLLTIESKLHSLPDFDRTTKDREKIYNINSIWNQEYNHLLQTEAFLSTLKKQDTKKSKGILAKYLIDYIGNGGVTLKKSQVPQAMVLNLFLKLSKKRVIDRSINEIAKEMEMPGPIVRDTLEKFFFPKIIGEQTIQYHSSKGLESKMVCYIIVLDLFLHNFEMDAEPLRRFLKIEDTQFIKYCTEIGCTVKKSNRTDGTAINIVLTAPLKINVVMPKPSTKTAPQDLDKIKQEQSLPKDESSGR